MGKLFQYKADESLEKKIEMITDYIIDVFSSAGEIKKIQIQDPYYSLEIFLNILEKHFRDTQEFIPDSKKIWENIFSEIFETDSIKEIEILSQMKEIDFPLEKKVKLGMYNAEFLNSKERSFKINIRNKTIKFYTHLHLTKRQESEYKKNEPNIHDRFILYHFDNHIQGLHVGCSLKDIEDKDILCTKISKILAKNLSAKYDILKNGRTE